MVRKCRGELEGNSNHHAERHEMQSALDVLTCLEEETRIWPTASYFDWRYKLQDDKH
jgi:hypothetical protein